MSETNEHDATGASGTIPPAGDAGAHGTPPPPPSGEGGSGEAGTSASAPSGTAGDGGAMKGTTEGPAKTEPVPGRDRPLTLDEAQALLAPKEAPKGSPFEGARNIIFVGYEHPPGVDPAATTGPAEHVSIAGRRVVAMPPADEQRAGWWADDPDAIIAHAPGYKRFRDDKGRKE